MPLGKQASEVLGHSSLFPRKFLLHFWSPRNHEAFIHLSILYLLSVMYVLLRSSSSWFLKVFHSFSLDNGCFCFCTWAFLKPDQKGTQLKWWTSFGSTLNRQVAKKPLLNVSLRTLLLAPCWKSKYFISISLTESNKQNKQKTKIIQFYRHKIVFMHQQGDSKWAIL